MPKKNLKTCKKGHQFFKSSTCPVCPICEQQRKPKDVLFSLLSAPARRALENEGILTLKQLSKYTEAEILALHGMGPNAMRKLHLVLDSEHLTFKKN